MKLYLTILGLCLISFSALAQKRIAVFDIDQPPAKKSLIQVGDPAAQTTILASVPGHIVSLYANDSRFIVIDKANSQLIENEQDRQKNEEFIDGYIVEQGKQEGFDYCYHLVYLAKEKNLLIRLYDVAKGTAIASKKVQVKVAQMIGSGFNAKIDAAIADINASVFQVRTEVVRMSEGKKGKAKLLLVATGYNQNAKEGKRFEIYNLVDEKVGNETISRENVVGNGMIKEVEDANFSQLKIIYGAEEVYKLLTSNNQLYIRN